ncbi:MAG TPA: hypothetical protein VLH77_06965 [Gammaproteobacteria bacterium]|nr:hypothetical protein [Gammaproteobacteria bacterium]
MRPSRVLCLSSLFVFILISGCTLLQHGDDPNYTLCKNLQGKIQFGSNTTTYMPGADRTDVEKHRLEATYDKLNCSQYQWLKF